MKLLRHRLIQNRMQYKVRCGIQTKLHRPRLLEGAKYISLGDHTNVREGSWLGAFPNQMPYTHDAPPKLEIQDQVYIGSFACITVINSIVIESGSMISDYFYASDHTHGYDPRFGSPTTQPLTSKSPVRVGRNCFIGYRVTITPGVTLGESCVVGAHSVVTRSFPPFTMLAGVPARAIKTFDFTRGEWAGLASEK